MQLAHLPRHARVITFDGRGNGKSDRPDTVEAYAAGEFAADAIAAEIGREVGYQPVETDGAARAAARIAKLL
jgi:hypothetical protein